MNQFWAGQAGTSPSCCWFSWTDADGSAPSNARGPAALICNALLLGSCLTTSFLCYNEASQMCSKLWQGRAALSNVSLHSVPIQRAVTSPVTISLAITLKPAKRAQLCRDRYRTAVNKCGLDQFQSCRAGALKHHKFICSAVCSCRRNKQEMM